MGKVPYKVTGAPPSVTEELLLVSFVMMISSGLIN
jgi:hypothetical protein